MKHALNSVEAVNEARRLALSEALGNPRFGPSEKLPVWMSRLLAMHDYDQNNRFLLADGGPTSIGNLTSPVGFSRTVYEAALSDLRVMNLVRVLATQTALVTWLTVSARFQSQPPSRNRTRFRAKLSSVIP